MQELAVLAARTMGMQRQFTAIADNVANVNTHGYKRLDLQFKEVISRPASQATASYVADRSLAIDYTTGSMETTNNPLDVALAGDGFFAVQLGNTTAYTRRGQFLLNGDGTLVTPTGNTVLDNTGQPIQVPEDAKFINISSDGTIATDQGILARLGVFTFTSQDLGKLQRAGDSGFIPREGATATVVETPTMKQGMLESSNVNAVQEMTNMEQVSRAYQNSLKLVKSLEDMESQAIRSLQVQ